MTTKTKTKAGELPGPGSARFPMPTEESWPQTAKDARGKALDGLESAFQPSAATESGQRHAHAPNAAPKHPQVDQAEWCLVVVPDGEYPTLEIFPNIGALTNRMRALEGDEANVFPFFGVPAPFTAGPNRFLELPDGQPHPVFDVSPYGKFVPDPQATLAVDPTYFLGPYGLRDGFPKTAVVDHRPTVAEAGAGNGAAVPRDCGRPPRLPGSRSGDCRGG
jgi:hypothetical protein